MEKLNLNRFGQSEQSYDPAAWAKMKADTLNEMEGALTGHECSKCRNRGSIAFYRDDGSIFTRECDCMKIRRCVWEMEKSGLKNIIRELTFETFIPTEDWQNTMKSTAAAYGEKPQGWLLLAGQSGCGKTHLCTAVCRQRLLAGDEVRYMPWRDKLAEIKACSLDSEYRTRLIDGYKNAQILYIDDLYKTGKNEKGVCEPRSSDINLAFEIINHRYINHLTTIVSTERTPQELVEIDEATGSRILEMAGSNVLSVARHTKRNYRLRGIVSL